MSASVLRMASGYFQHLLPGCQGGNEDREEPVSAQDQGRGSLE